MYGIAIGGGVPILLPDVEDARRAHRVSAVQNYIARFSGGAAPPPLHIRFGTIADEIAERFGVERLAIVHRIGDVPVGEASIVVVAVSPHRDAAFQAARYGIDETKARAPIWKAERFADGHVWIGAPARTGPEDA